MRTIYNIFMMLLKAVLDIIAMIIRGVSSI